MSLIKNADFLFEILKKVPFYKMRYYFCKTIFLIGFFKDGEKIRDNFKIIFGDKKDTSEYNRMLRNFNRQRRNILSAQTFFCSTPYEELFKNNFFMVHGYENIENSIKKEKGIILLPLHFGLSYVASVYLAYKKFRTNTVGHVQTKKLFSMWKELGVSENIKYFEYLEKEKYLNFTFLPDFFSMVKCFMTLKNNEVLCIHPDAHYLFFNDDKNLNVRRKMLVNFLGYKVYAAMGIISLHLKTGAPLVLSTVVNKKASEFTINYYPPLETKITGNYETDLRNNLDLLYENIEKIIFNYPEKWLGFEWIDKMIVSEN